MSCNCSQPEKAALWTPIPDFRQPTEIQKGENIDCYMKRSGSQSGLMNDVGAKIPDRIDNTSLTSDLSLNVNTNFALSPGSTRTPTSWTIAVNGTTGLGPLTELTWDSAAGKLSGTVTTVHANTNYKVLITSLDATGDIDSREFNFFPKQGNKDTTVSFIVPLEGSGKQAVHVTCGYGPRKPPAQGASSDHLGMDFARLDHSPGNILAAADGTVVRCGKGDGWGNVIFIEHYDANRAVVATTVYAHWSEAYVKVGQIVAQGQKIALEGNVGIGTGVHLHFEMHKGKWKNPVDPAPYLNGALTVAVNNDPTTTGPDGTPSPTAFATQTNTGVGMTSAESSSSGADCPGTAPGPLPGDTALPVGGTENPPATPATNVGKYRSDCAPATGTPSPAEVTNLIQQTCTAAGLNAQETNFILTVATVESGLDPYAKNPTSSAMGLYQMLTATASTFYSQLGIQPTCQNRCDVVMATKAMILFYQGSFKPYYTKCVASGYTTLAGKPLDQSNAWIKQYPNMTMGAFMYGLLHHDGVGNAVAGVDKGGVAYWNSKVKA